MISKEILCNNVLLITEPVKSAKSVAIGFFFFTGSRYEKEGEHGLSHLCEHMLFKGSKKLCARDISLVFDRMGGSVNAYTSDDCVCMYCLIPSGQENVALALETFCDMTENCIFDTEELEKERSVVQNEIASSLDDSEECAKEAASRFIWKDQNIGYNIGGTVEDVEKLSRSQLIDWYKKYFVCGELLVSVAGNVESSQVKPFLEKLSNHKPCIEYPKEFHFKQKAVWNFGLEFISSSFNQMQIFVVFKLAAPLSEKQSKTLSVLDALFGETMSCRLFDSLREKAGLCYNVYSSRLWYEDFTAWYSYASCDKKNLVKVCNLLLAELKRLKDEPPSDKEILDAKRNLCGSNIIACENMESLCNANKSAVCRGFPLNDLDSDNKKLMEVSRKDLIDIIDTLVNFSRMSFVVFGKKISAKDKKMIAEEIEKCKL